MKNAKGYPSHYAIAQAWPQFVYDMCEPACFACKWYYSRGDDFASPEVAWRASRLERCHIVADSVGGTTDPRNLLLLCKRCHREAPMTNRRDIMLAWVERREDYYKWLFRSIQRLMLDFKISDGDLAAAGSISPEDLAAKAREIDLDFHPENMGNGLPHGAVVVARAVIDDRLAAIRQQRYQEIEAL